MFISEPQGSKDYFIVNHAFYLNGWDTLVQLADLLTEVAVN